MEHYEVIARSPEQAKEKAAALHGLNAADLEVTDEFDPDDADLDALDEEEEKNPALEIDGEPVLYRLKAGLRGYLEHVKQLTEKLLVAFGEGITAEPAGFGRGVIVRITAPDPSILIGKQGATLSAIQHVVMRCCIAHDEDFPDVILDLEGFRERRLMRLAQMATDAAAKALQMRRNFALEPMNPVERKYVHNLLKEIEGISTRSDGMEPDRHIVVLVEGGDRAPVLTFGRPERGGRGGRGRDDRGGRGHGDRDDNRGNRDDNRGNRDHGRGNRDDNRGNRAGNGRGGRDDVRGIRRESDARHRLAEDPAPKKAAPVSDGSFEDVEIEHNRSILPQYKAPDLGSEAYDPNRKFEDEIES